MLFIQIPLGLAEDLTRVQLPEGAWVSEKIHNLPGLENVGRIAPGIYRGAQPEDEGFQTLKQMGIRTVINLRANHGEVSEVEALGMRSMEFPMGMFEEIDEARVDRVIEAMADSSHHPVFVHCKLGQDRTGMVVAIYRMEKEGWSLEQAEAEMQEYGFNDIWVHLMKQVRKHATSKGLK